MTCTLQSFVDAKILEMNASNMVVVAASGNDGVDVNTKSPAGVDEIITVGSFDSDLNVTSFTNTPHSSTNSFINYGAQLDMFAYGVEIDVADKANVANYLTGTGSSLSAGLVAGIVTHYVQRDPALTSSEIKDQMLQQGHATGQVYLTFDESDANVDYSSVYKSVISTKNVDSRVLTTAPSGRIGAEALLARIFSMRSTASLTPLASALVSSKRLSMRASRAVISLQTIVLTASLTPSLNTSNFGSSVAHIVSKVCSMPLPLPVAATSSSSPPSEARGGVRERDFDIGYSESWE